ncbi:MAG: hypothetical protein II269_05055 [Bacteroidaceae bacterium]|nr:hypothetical protein [Bacteroidaceae bacterium]
MPPSPSKDSGVEPYIEMTPSSLIPHPSSIIHHPSTIDEEPSTANL